VRDEEHAQAVIDSLERAGFHCERESNWPL